MGQTETGDNETLIKVRAGIPNMNGEMILAHFSNMRIIHILLLGLFLGYGERLETTVRAGSGGKNS